VLVDIGQYVSPSANDGNYLSIQSEVRVIAGLGLSENGISVPRDVKMGVVNKGQASLPFRNIMIPQASGLIELNRLSQPKSDQLRLTGLTGHRSTLQHHM
jgi:hypothetical protein